MFPQNQLCNMWIFLFNYLKNYVLPQKKGEIEHIVGTLMKMLASKAHIPLLP